MAQNKDPFILRQVYLDHNATTPVHPEVLEAFSLFCGRNFGNPSSIHWSGRIVKEAVETAREEVAALVNCHPSEIVFTSSGTEADNMAIKGVAAADFPGGHIITTATEHPAVLGSCLHLESLGYRITRVPVDRKGVPDLEQLERAFTPDTILVTMMWANHETGSLMPVERVAALAGERNVPFHCDAVQGVGKVPVDFRGSGVSMLALSGHKLNAPKGVGALVIRRGVKLIPLLHGGPQERGRRAGTENVPGIVALGRACSLARERLNSEAERLRRLRARLESGILSIVPGAGVNGDLENRLPNTSSISFPGTSADSLLFSLDLSGIAASSGSACSSGRLKFSPVLAAMGLSPDEAAGTIRFSLGSTTSEDDIEYLLQVLPEIVERFRK